MRGKKIPVKSFKNRNRSPASFSNINIIGPCSFGCFFCLGNDLKAEFDQYNDLKTHFSKWKNFDKYISILKAGRLTNKGLNRIYITGQNTDPLLYKYLDELIDYLKSEGFYVGLRTNGLAAKTKMKTINKFDSVSFTMLSLDKKILEQIVRRKNVMPDWRYIFSHIKTKTRVAIVVNRYNLKEVFKMVKFLSKYPFLSYIQLRKIATDTRYELLKEDMEGFKKLEKEIAGKFKKVGGFEGAEIFLIEGKECVLWKTVDTTVNSWNYFSNGVYSDNYFIIEGYLKNKHKSIVYDLHIKSRFEKPDSYPLRFSVPDERIDWQVPFQKYNPPYYVHKTVLDQDRTKVKKGWADPEKISQKDLSKKSYEGQIIFDKKIPLNPKGRTGIAGRGLLGKWGPNYAVDPIITRYNNKTKNYEMLSVQREGEKQWAIPGIMGLDGESISDALKRRLNVKIGKEINMEGAVTLYQGYVDDPRNTDNAWIETEVLHLDLPFKLTKDLKLDTDLLWIKWMPMTNEELNMMYANHGDFAKLALVRLEPTTILKPSLITENLKNYLHKDKPVVAVFDTHGTLLKPTWKEEWKMVYREVMGKEVSEEWVKRFIIGKLNFDITQALAKTSKQPIKTIEKAITKVRKYTREETIPEAMEKVLEFIRALNAAKIPIAIISDNEKIAQTQLKKNGFFEFIPKENFITGKNDLKKVHKKYPKHTILFFDDWIERIPEVKKLGGVIFGVPQGEGEGRAINEKRFMHAGADFILHDWNEWELIYKAILDFQNAE